MSLDIRIDSLDLHRGGRPVLENFSLLVAPGERVAVTGPSGVGKSTLLQAMAGLISPSAGTIEIDGHPLNGPLERVALMQQRPALLPWATVGENVSLGLRFANRPGHEIAAEVRRLLRRLGIADKIDALPHQLSGGQQQRVALARSLARAPEILLLDEPFSALDPELRVSLRQDIARLSAETDMTVILVTHDQADVEALCTRRVNLGHPMATAA